MMQAVQRFAQDIQLKAESNSWPEKPALEWAVVYLATELWDCGFNSPELESSFKSALSELSRYSAGER